MDENEMTVRQQDTADDSGPVGSGWKPSDENQDGISTAKDPYSGGSTLTYDKNPENAQSASRDGTSHPSGNVFKTILALPFLFVAVLASIWTLLALAGLLSGGVGADEAFIKLLFFLVIDILAIMIYRSLRGSWRRRFSGEAHNVKEGNIPISKEKSLMTLTFQIIQYDNSGNRLPPIPVEIRGKNIIGIIREADKLKFRGHRNRQQIVRTKKVRNITTGSTVKTMNPTFHHFSLSTFLGWTMWYMVMGLIIVGIIALIRSCNH